MPRSRCSPQAREPDMTPPPSRFSALSDTAPGSNNPSTASPLKQERADYTKQKKQNDSRRQLHGRDPVSLIEMPNAIAIKASTGSAYAIVPKIPNITRLI